MEACRLLRPPQSLCPSVADRNATGACSLGRCGVGGRGASCGLGPPDDRLALPLCQGTPGRPADSSDRLRAVLVRRRSESTGACSLGRCGVGGRGASCGLGLRDSLLALLLCQGTQGGLPTPQTAQEPCSFLADGMPRGPAPWVAAVSGAGAPLAALDCGTERLALPLSQGTPWRPADSSDRLQSRARPSPIGMPRGPAPWVAAVSGAGAPLAALDRRTSGLPCRSLRARQEACRLLRPPKSRACPSPIGIHGGLLPGSLRCRGPGRLLRPWTAGRAACPAALSGHARRPADSSDRLRAVLVRRRSESTGACSLGRCGVGGGRGASCGLGPQDER